MYKILRRPGQKREKHRITKERPRVGPLRPKTLGYLNEKVSLN